jgi:LysM repeat protein
MPRLTFAFLLILQLTLCHFSFSQTYTQSKTEKTINGKKYLIHKVEKGQSLYGIAKLYGVDLNAMILENPEAIDGIKTGQELKVPTEKPRPSVNPADFDKYVCHTVAKGETVYSICNKYQISEQQLNQLNPDLKLGLKENSILKIREKTRQQVSVNTTTLTSTPNTAVTDTTPLPAVNKDKKKVYNVGVFLPFHFKENELLNVDELVVNRQNFPAAEQLAIDFYEGLRQAADSLKSQDFSVSLKVYDVGERDSSSVLKFTKEENFRNLDLIIGPLYNSAFRIISSEAKKLQVPCVSPLTQQNKILFENVFTSKTTPANTTLVEGLAQYCMDSLFTQNVVLINSGVAKDQSLTKAFKQFYNDKKLAKGGRDTISEARGINGAKTAYKAEKINYYVVPSENEVFIADFLTHLNMFAEKKENIRVIGLRKWITLDNLDLEYLNRFGFIFPASYFVRDEDPLVKKLNTTYRQKYFTDADDPYFLANEIGLYYFGLLKSTGPTFCLVLDDFPKKGTVMNFDFYHPNNLTGFENRAVQIIGYDEYKLKRIN